MKRFLPFLVFSFISTQFFAQIGGDNVYEFLNLSPSARVTALGGNLITVKDDDLSLAYNNPAMLNESMQHALSFNHSFYLGDISHGFANYGFHLKKQDITIHAGVQYINYGTFFSSDVFGNIIGEFNAGEYAVVVGAGKQLYERLSVGVNAKFISSQFEAYNSVGIAGDVAAMYSDTSKNFTATMVFKNIGTQLTKYNENKEPLPYDVQIGISKKLKYLPLRFSVIANNLQRWNVLYDDPNAENDILILGGENETQKENKVGPIVDNLFRHLVFNGEFSFGKKENLSIRVGYNHLRRSELTVKNFRNLAGFSGGVRMKIKWFRISYGHGFYHLAGTSNHLSISTKLSEFKVRKKVKKSKEQ